MERPVIFSVPNLPEGFAEGAVSFRGFEEIRSKKDCFKDWTDKDCQQKRG